MSMAFMRPLGEDSLTARRVGRIIRAEHDVESGGAVRPEQPPVARVTQEGRTMKVLKPAPIVAALTVMVAATLTTPPLGAEVLEKSKQVAGMTVRYKVVVPDGYDPTKAYPAILAFGGGPQTMNTVDNILNRNFRAEAERRGYIVIAPAAPNGQLFFEDGARVIPEFLKGILADYRIQGGKFHIAGPSNGGIAAFHVAAANPQYFLSVTAFPGYMWQPNAARPQAISKMCVLMSSRQTEE